MLVWVELEEVLSDVEVSLKNWTLTYIEEGSEYSVLTPNSMIFGRNIKLPDDSPEEEEASDNWKKWQWYAHKSKEPALKRWVHEYLAALRESYNLGHKEKPMKINIKDVVMIKGDKKNCGKWKIGIIKMVSIIFMGKDNTTRSIKLSTRKSIVEKPVQLLYPMKLHCVWRCKTLNVNADKFWPKTSAAAVAESVKAIWFAASNGGRAMWKSQGHAQFDELCLGENPFNVALPVFK